MTASQAVPTLGSGPLEGEEALLEEGTTSPELGSILRDEDARREDEVPNTEDTERLPADAFPEAPEVGALDDDGSGPNDDAEALVGWVPEASELADWAEEGECMEVEPEPGTTPADEETDAPESDAETPAAGDLGPHARSKADKSTNIRSLIIV